MLTALKWTGPRESFGELADFLCQAEMPETIKLEIGGWALILKTPEERRCFAAGIKLCMVSLEGDK